MGRSTVSIDKNTYYQILYLEIYMPTIKYCQPYFTIQLNLQRLIEKIHHTGNKSIGAGPNDWQSAIGGVVAFDSGVFANFYSFENMWMDNRVTNLDETSTFSK